MITAKQKELQRAYNKRAESVDPGVGYRILGPNEVLQYGDECTSANANNNYWTFTGQAGDLVSRPDSDLVYRRRDNPPPQAGEGYRLLTADEQIQTGDEWLLGSTWRVANSSVGLTPAKLNQWRRERSLSTGTRYYRRPVAVTVENKSKPNPLWKTAPYTAFFLQYIFGDQQDECVRILREHLAAKVNEGPINPGSGNRLVTEGETILASDEYLDNQVWVTTGCVGDALNKTHLPHRRSKKIAPPPGKGFRLLSSYDIVRKGDEFWSVIGEWIAAQTFGIPVKTHGYAYRRNVEQERKDFIAEHPFLGPTTTCAEANSASVYERVFGLRATSKFSATETPTPISPGNGYRTLTSGESLQFGDEGWDTFGLVFKPVPLDALGTVLREKAHLIRRKVDTAVQRELNDLRTKAPIQDQIIKAQASYIRSLKDERVKLRTALESIEARTARQRLKVEETIYSIAREALK